jgi:hypothetical protein
MAGKSTEANRIELLQGTVKREEFRSALLQHVATTLLIHTPNLSKESAGDIAQVVVLNVKAVVTHQAFFDPASGTAEEFRDMTRLYLQNRLGAFVSREKSIPS